MIVGIIGTGMLGAAVGLRLLEKNVQLVAYNRTINKTAELESKGAEIVLHPKDVADKADVIITCVKDANAIKQIAFGKDGITDCRRAGIIICDMSTIEPSLSREIAGRFAKKEMIMLDTPVMGGPNVAINGRLVMMASGDKKSFERIKEILDIVAEKVFYLGSAGTAHSVKLAMNLQIAMLAISLSEGIALSRKASVDPKTFLKVLNSTYFKTGMSENKAYKMIEGRFEPTFLLRNLEKDLQAINGSAKSLGLKLPMSELAEKIYKNAVEDGFGDLDYTGILAYLDPSTHN